MKYGTIAGINKPVSRLVLGADNQTTAEDAAIFDYWVSAGGNALDTAWVYSWGRCEEVVGEWMTARNIRDELVVIGKGAHTPHCTPEGLDRELGESLERLRTDYVDLYLLHRDNPDVPVGEFVDALNSHRDHGRVRAFGGSNWTPARVDEANAYASARGVTGFVALSNSLSLARALDVPWAGCVAMADDASREWLAARNLALLPWSSQGRGFFTPRATRELPEEDELVRCWYSDANFERKARAAQLARERGVEEINVALAWVLHQPFEVFPLIGPRTADELHASLVALDVSLTDAEVAWLDLSD